MSYEAARLANEAERVKLAALPAMHEMVARVTAHDAVVGEQAATYLETFERRMPWASPPETADARPRLVGPHAPGETPFGYVVVLPAEVVGDNNGCAWWIPAGRALGMFEGFDPCSPLAASVLFHELYHAHDPNAAAMPPHPAAGEPFPVETEAWDFQGRLLDGFAGGRLTREVSAAADGISQGSRRHISPGGFALPELSRAFLAQFFPSRPPAYCLHTLLGQFQYELAKEQIRRAAPDGVTAERELATLYTRFIASVRQPLAAREEHFIQTMTAQL